MTKHERSVSSASFQLSSHLTVVMLLLSLVDNQATTEEGSLISSLLDESVYDRTVRPLAEQGQF